MQPSCLSIGTTPDKEKSPLLKKRIFPGLRRTAAAFILT
ncbi:hypothetical protein EPIR_1788 [Erwinia piriflorinigrans CFBP 5888]|uniref:Uncharacterized protein n=1 Tax=Erwinia piriflorinigrans CFBP 5888 TaxID=1161919 RepID=V5Z883_9GAMM|nr:hypothetical protein EPIR_1788 [Erwinia piriflorinigrans CFBP 5888]